MKSLCAITVLLLACAACNSNTQAAAPQPAPRVFSEADVTKAQDEITHDYQNRGFELEQVSLIKDADRHLSGFVKIRKASGIIRPQLVKKCSATMDQDSGKYIYGCQ
ncbi:MAG: hypothetical protein WB919_13735 [Candidatus Sulfotelmatobacter sp.]